MGGRTYRVVEQPEVLSDYIAITDHVTRWTDDPRLADRTVDAIRAFIKTLDSSPHRGRRRDDLRPGLRVIPFGKRTLVAFEIDEIGGSVMVTRVFYGGQDYETLVRSEPPE